MPHFFFPIMSPARLKARKMAEDVFVAEVSDFPPGRRHLIKVGGVRNVAVWNHRGKFYALDNACYHHGGPLLTGDIEELGGHPCIICPWHSYRIALDTGEGLYLGVVPSPTGPPEQVIKSKGCKQRTHRTYVRDGKVFCSIDLSGPKIESDGYATMQLANSEQATSRPIGPGGPSGLHSNVRSGHVFSGGAPMPLRSPLNNVPCTVRCIQVTRLTRSVSRFVMIKESGTFSKRMVPGQWVTLQLPMGNRTWTITSVREDGGWFSICVKHAGQGGRGGSKLLHEQGTNFSSVLVDSGGSFSLTLLKPLYDSVEGRIVMISAGIGITPMLASLFSPSAQLPNMRVVHAHCDRTLDDVPDFPRLQELAQRVGEAYHLQLFLSAHRGETPGDLIVARRFSCVDVPRILGLFGGASCAVMLCGPPAFMEEISGELQRCGVPPDRILTEEFS
jgi:ferredoxin-NADP reductase/nitrite reductase/ring-hydroxylating ferredoxin subunit